MRRWLPYPMVSAFLLGIWLLLAQSVAAGDVLLGAVLAVIIPLAVRSLQPLGYPVVRKPAVLVRLLAMALVEIVRSCLNVTWIIMLGRRRDVNAQFVRIPLDLRHPFGLAALSCLINTTPGTVWAEILPGTHELALHVFDLHDEQWWIDTIKNAYEKPLIEIFEENP
ncbi:MAG: Na+/H+ antiporter subunit E [Burkholderiaceae bacterium]|jgi:multicomponent K+:H+ antiporter subunit E|nr:Na+/H+ antiporter subunit E [Burkholderiaceae bacterium]MEB2318635.1 Na+/H+ antiporter subunit E [Pseudomonadota bacterium]